MNTTTGIPVWSNANATLEAILDDARAEAMDLAEETITRQGTDPADDWLVNTIIEAGLQTASMQNPWNTPRAETLRQAIEGLDLGTPGLASAAAEYNDAYRQDEIANLDGIRLDRPVIITGKAEIWRGTRTMCSTLRFDTIGDIIRQAPWNDMDVDDWSIDPNDDLRYTGIHHDGVNTCTYRQLKPDARITTHTSYSAILRMSEPLGPIIRSHYGIER